MKFTNTLFARIGNWSKKYSNLPDRYINRVTEKVFWRTPRGKPQYLPRTIQKKKLHFSIFRPWTLPYHEQNKALANHKFVHVEPIKNWSFFRGDRVEVLYGRDKGKQGFVKDIIQERNWIIVRGLNTKLECIGKTETFPGLYCQMEQPLLVPSQVQLVDPSDLMPTSIEWRYLEDGSHERVSCRTGRIIPIPPSSEETKDYKYAEIYKEQEKDTTEKDVKKVTFEGQLKTFEMDIMDKMNIKEDRVPMKYYWY
ncbi:mitochondrial ribosomal protein L24 [Ptiloglossa arizonensis]|uniref:mitochondrial ribosomal protein L24 n=1 Tax=Ptiloglossa arizonensis TaxID=3350558 RepID=UPI003FA11887